MNENPHYPKICLFDESDGISKAVIEGADWEPEVCEEMARLYVPGTDVIDVGACFGLNSLGMHRRKPITGTVHLFEPQHDVFSALRYNSRHLPNNKLYNIALADTVRLLFFEQVHGNVGGTPFQGEGGSRSSPFACPMSSTIIHTLAAPLDSFYFPNPISVIKIDAEGAELNVLRGAREIIDKHRPAILIEVWIPNRKDVFALLQDMEYVLVENIKNDFGDDFVFKPCRPGRAERDTILDLVASIEALENKLKNL